MQNYQFVLELLSQNVKLLIIIIKSNKFEIKNHIKACRRIRWLNSKCQLFNENNQYSYIIKVIT